MSLPALLAPWPGVSATTLGALDLALAQWLQQQHASDDVRHRWLAALTSHQWSRGHACLDVDALQTDAASLLGWSAEAVAALPPDLNAALATLPWCDEPNAPLVRARSAAGVTRLYLRRAWQAEQDIRAALLRRVQQAPDLPDGWMQRLDALFAPSEDNTPDLQRQACAVAAQQSVCLITGGPGTGKTTTVARLLALLLGMQPGLRIALAAPTGKAAARLGESIAAALPDLPDAVRERIPTQAQTLHRLLSTGPSSRAQLACDLVIVDEASMIDLEMMARLLRAVPDSARLVLLGDRDQLASVEAGAVMAQLCDMPELAACTVRLTRSHRFDPTRGIGQWAQAVNQGVDANALDDLWQATPTCLSQTPDHEMADVTRLSAQPSDDELGRWLRGGWQRWLQRLAAIDPARGCDDADARDLLQDFSRFGVLCALREGPQGVARLTRRIERLLQLPAPDALGWYAGRPVMITRNDYALGLMNGDIGLCLPHREGGWRVAFPTTDAAGQASVRWFQTARLAQVETVWAMTVHKSQGSEFQHVLLVLPERAAPVLTRELIYTGLTRARQRLTLWVPSLPVLREACQQRVQRSGGLAE